MNHISCILMLKVKVVKSEQEGVTWLYALLRRERKHSGMSRVVIFVRTDASALALHQRPGGRAVRGSGAAVAFRAGLTW